MTDLVVSGAVTAVAEANHGRWIAKCPRPFCTNAMQVWPGQHDFQCLGADSCDIAADLTWPPDPEAIEQLLMMRPAVATRNWLPGETLQQLVAENAERGLLPVAWVELAQASPDGSADILVTVDERVVGGLLFQQLEAAGSRREIGGQ
jgi:hypothetical protein